MDCIWCICKHGHPYGGVIALLQREVGEHVIPILCMSHRLVFSFQKNVTFTTFDYMNITMNLLA